MNAPRAPERLIELVERVRVDPPPIHSVVAAGRAARRRRRGAILAGTTAVLAVGAAFAVSANSGSDREEVAADNPTTTNPSLGDDTVLVGVNGAAVEVPASWRDIPAECEEGAWSENAVYHPWPGDCVPSEAAGTSFLRFAANLDQRRIVGLRPAGVIDGHEIVEGEVVCELSNPAQCSLTFGIPDLDAYFTVGTPQEASPGVGSPTMIDEIRGSLRLLQDGHVAVPPIGTMPGKLGPTEQTLLEAGFEVQVDTDEYVCAESASCIGDAVTSIDPEPGTVVPAGSTVTIKYVAMVPD